MGRLIDEYKDIKLQQECDSKIIDTLWKMAQKYQKIQKILKDDTYYEEYGNNAERFIVSAISEVLEDGRI